MNANRNTFPVSYERVAGCVFVALTAGTSMSATLGCARPPLSSYVPEDSSEARESSGGAHSSVVSSDREGTAPDSAPSATAATVRVVCDPIDTDFVIARCDVRVAATTVLVQQVGASYVRLETGTAVGSMAIVPNSEMPRLVRVIECFETQASHMNAAYNGSLRPVDWVNSYFRRYSFPRPEVMRIDFVRPSTALGLRVGDAVESMIEEGDGADVLTAHYNFESGRIVYTLGSSTPCVVDGVELNPHP